MAKPTTVQLFARCLIGPTAVPLDDGAVVREQSSAPVYVIFGGAKFWIPNPDVLNAYGGWPAVVVVPDGALANVPTIPRDGTVLREQSNAPVYVMIGGQKCWIPDPPTLEQYGGWAAVRVVPDGGLGLIPEGPAVPAVAPPPPTGWGADSGNLQTTDTADSISFQIEHSALGSDAVEFVLNSVTQKWKKWLILDDGLGGRWTIETDGPKTEDRNGLYLYQLPQGKLEFWKAKFLGQMTKVLELPIAFLQGGDRVYFRWERD